MYVVALVTRELGGGRPAQALCAWGYAFASLTLIMGHVLLTSTLDLVVWPAVLLFVIRAQLRHQPQWWLAAIFTAVGAAVGETAVPVAKTLVGQDGWFTARLLTIVPVVAVFALVASPLLTPLGRWCMCVKKPSWKAIPE